MRDITQQGVSGLSGVRTGAVPDEEIRLNVDQLKRDAALSYHNRKRVASKSHVQPYEDIGLELDQAGYGQSRFDKGIQYSQLDNLEDWRGQEQPWYAQLGAGVLKGIGLAGTTFLDGTVGLIYGIGQAIAEGDASMLFNNDLSVALRQFNQMMEEELPNYRTKDEIENPWALRNIFSMNTFADDFLKNLGFTVGAFYSGNAYLGALKGIGLAGKMSTSAAKLIGSTLSGFSEARIEAGNLYDEQVKAEQQNIDAAKEQIKAEVLSAPEYTQAFDNLKQEYEAKLAQINAQPDNLVKGIDGRLTNPKTALQNQLFNEYQSKIKALENSAMSEINTRVQRLEQDVHERAKNAAMADMVLNAIYLPFTDAYAYGKLYGRKFNFKSELADKVDDAAKVGRKQATKAIDKAAEAEAIEETLGKRVVRQGKEYVANPVKAKQAAAKGFKIGLSEGSEEMNQAFFSSFSSNLYQPDSPDAYYNALKNDDYDIQTKDAMTALTEGFMDSWGNTQTYKEGLVGFLTGMIGMPTFGRVNNSDSNTYLGKGKMIGLSRGIFGEIQNANRLNREAAEAVQVMNKIQDRVDDAKSFFIRAKSFRDATDGYSKESNKFEFNSAADNELFHAIDAFARTGRLQDLKDIISEDIDNASQEQLEDIARNFSSDENQYKEVDGSDMASTEDGQKEMKDIINQRKKEIFDGINSYEKALEKARRIGNNSLTSDQVAELAWLQWKVDKFSDRFNSIKDKDMNKLTELQNAIHAFKNGRGRGMIDEESEEGKNILQAIDTVDLFIDLLRTSKNPIQFGTLVKNSGNTRDWLRFFGYPIFEGVVGYNAEEFDDLINDLDDTVKIAEASESFNKRYKEFKADPTKLIKNREKIDEKKQSEKDVKDNADLKTSLDNMSVSEIAEKLRNKEISDDQIASIEDKERKTPIEPDIDLTAAQKLEQAMQINDAAERAINALQQQMEQAEGGIEAFEDAVKQIEENMSKAESLDDFFDLSSAAFVDSQILAPEEPADLTPEQKAALDEELDDRRDAATAINKGILEKVKKDKEVADNLPEPPVPSTEPEEVSTGHDGTTQAKTVAETNKAKKETERKEAEQPKVDYTAEAVELLRQFGIVAPDKSHQVIPLATILDSFNKFTALDNNVLACIERCRNIAAYGVLARSIDPRYEKGNILPLIDNMLLTYAGKPKAVTKSTEEKTADEEDVVTPTISRTQIEGQERQEAKRSYDESSKTGPLNYWKPATTEYPIHDDNKENITYAQRLLNIATDEVIKLLPQVKSSDKSQLRNAIEDLVKSLLTEPLSQVQNSEAYKIAELLVGSEKLDKVLQMFTDGKIAKVDLQRTRRTVAVTDYLQDCKAYEKIDNGQVTKGTKVHFKVDKKLNEKAGETVILITDTEGNPLGDIMSKDEQIASRQVGLLPFIEKCEKYLESHKDEEIVELPYESTISQLMVGRAPYVNEANRPTLNAVFEGQPFKIGVAMTAGANATIKMTSSPKSEKLTDEEVSIWEPLSAIKGQPYLLLPTGNTKKKYICVPFLMPVYNSGVADTALGRAIRDVLSQIMDAETKENAIKIKDKLLELLSLKDIWINYDNGNVHFPVTRHCENSQRTLYKGPLNNNTIDTILNKLQGTSFRVNRKYINGDYEGQDYNSMIGELATCNIKRGTTHTINNWFTINPIGISSTGEASESKAERVKPIGTNPNAKPKSSANTSGMLTVVGNSLVDPDTFEVYEMDGKTPFKGQPNAIIVRKARAFGLKENKDMTQPYDTDWGRYDPVKNKIIAPKEETPTPAEPVKSEKEQSIINWLSNATNVSIIKDICRTSNSVEEVITKIINEHFSDAREEVKNFVKDILRFDSARKIVQSYIDETHPRVEEPEQPVVPQTEQPVVSDEEVPQGDILESGDTLNASAKAKGYLRTQRRKNVWEALNLAQKNALLAMSKLKGEQTMKTLESPAYFDNNKGEFKKDITSLLGGFKLREAKSNSKVWNQQQERRWLAKVLPNLNQAERLRIVDAAIKVGNEKNPITAWGMFQNGIITIWNKAARGTLYHEAFHTVTDLLLTDDERKAMFDSARQAYSNLEQIALEERLAEDFRRYVQLEEKPVIGRLIRLFRTLKHILQNLLGKEPYLNTLFYKINRGEFANREPKVIIGTFDPNNPDIRYRRVDHTTLSKIRSFYNSGLSYGNLSDEQLEYLKQRKITKEQYNSMTMLEKEVLFKCMFDGD